MKKIWKVIRAWLLSLLEQRTEFSYRQSILDEASRKHQRLMILTVLCGKAIAVYLIKVMTLLFPKG